MMHCSHKSFVEIKVGVRLLDVGPITLLEIFGQDHVSVLTHSMHSCFLTNSCNLQETTKLQIDVNYYLREKNHIAGQISWMGMYRIETAKPKQGTETNSISNIPTPL